MSRAILNDLTELVEAGLITSENADNIQVYYKNKKGSSGNSLFVVFALLGAILVGLGIILIIAHNWDSLSRPVKTIFSFLPLLTGQLICIYVLLKKYFSVAWRESSASFLFLAVGASISLVSQVYNIPGNISSFIITWMLLCLPLIYIMNSRVASLMFICGITYFVIQAGYFDGWYSSPGGDESYKYWFLLAAVIPFYYNLITKYSKSNFTVFHNWFVVLSVIIALGTIAKSTEEFMFLAYMALFSIIYTAQYLPAFKAKKQASEFYTIGSLGIVIILLILSFDSFWGNLYKQHFVFNELLTAPEVIVSAFLLLSAGYFIYRQNKNKPVEEIDVMGFVFLPFTAVFFIGFNFPEAAVILINLMILTLGILLIREGAVKNHLGILNYGLIIISALVACRFFDSDLSFVVRGILFLTVGAGFFATNYWMLKRRSTNEQ